MFIVYIIQTVPCENSNELFHLKAMVSFSNSVLWPVTDVIAHPNKTAVSDHH